MVKRDVIERQHLVTQVADGLVALDDLRTDHALDNRSAALTGTPLAVAIAAAFQGSFMAAGAFLLNLWMPFSVQCPFRVIAFTGFCLRSLSLSIGTICVALLSVFAPFVCMCRLPTPLSRVHDVRVRFTIASKRLQTRFVILPVVRLSDCLRLLRIGGISRPLGSSNARLAMAYEPITSATEHLRRFFLATTTTTLHTPIIAQFRT